MEEAEWLGAQLMTESNVSKQIRLAVNGRPDMRIFRYQSGKYQLIDGRWVVAGFTGAPDFMGWQIRNGVPEFIAIEVKRPGGRIRPEQIQWRKFAASQGVRSIIADSAESALSQLLN